MIQLVIPETYPFGVLIKNFMPKKKQPDKSPELPKPAKEPEIKPMADPEEPLNVSEEDPDKIPDEDPFKNPPPYEPPPPGERP